ncbi:AraC family transcriptional regulator N-terminal domain-containing protein [Devosia sp.]|uniref:AraC family transcriptional regulator n=1 Tax=Devosia sp. TaxID=1871048 RepID=UPI003A9397C6
MTALDLLRDTVSTALAAQGNASPYHTAIPPLVLLRSTSERHPTHLVHQPALCVVVQGAKWTSFGTRRLVYRSGQAMVAGLELPGVSQVMEGGPDAPYLSAIVGLDLALMREVHEGLATPPEPVEDSAASGFVIDLEPAVLDCVNRLVGLLAEPAAIGTLLPGLMRELSYRLLSGPHGGRFDRLVVGSERDRRLLGALQHLRHHFAEPMRVEALAAMAAMSPTAFHRQFKALTAMTPVQYQKQMRLMEARRLMLVESCSAETVAFRVGYASPSQFSREYARFFGAPPRRDIARLNADERQAETVPPAA